VRRLSSLFGVAAFVLSLLALGVPSSAEARCFSFRGQSIKVCVSGDDSRARNQATSVCEDVTGDDCSISGNSGECRRSSSVRCYDGSGNEQSHIDPD
jgi:hypothetical protein